MSGLFAGTPWERPVTCERCGKPRAECACPHSADGALCPPQRQPARVRRERRGGRTVTIVSGLDAVASDLPALLKLLKHECATGGTLASGALELQGDHREKIVARLREMGYPARAAGG